MQIELVLKDVHMGRYARERVEYKLSKVVEHFHRELPVRVVLEDHKGLFTARVFSALNQHDFVGQHESRSMLEALDEAIVKFGRQLGKLGERSSRRGKAQRGRRGEVNGHAVAAAVLGDELDEFGIADQGAEDIAVEAPMNP